MQKKLLLALKTSSLLLAPDRMVSVLADATLLGIMKRRSALSAQ